MIPTRTGIPGKIERQIRDIYNGKVGEHKKLESLTIFVLEK